MTAAVAAAPTAVDPARRRRITIALFAAGVATFVSMYSTQALLPALSEYFAVSPAGSALAVSLTTGLLAVAIVPASALSERFGRTPVMVASAVASATIGVVLAWSPSIEVLLAGRAVQGIALAGVPAVAMAYLAEEVDGASLGAAMGQYVAGTTIGGLIGRVVPAFTLDIASWRWALEAAAVIALVCTIAFGRLVPASRNFAPRHVGFVVTSRHLAEHLRNPVLLGQFGLGFVLMGGFVTTYNFLGYRLLAAPFRLSESVVGLVFLLYLAGTVSSTVAGRLADRLGRAATLTGAVVVAALGLAATLPDRLLLVLAGMLLFTAGFFGAHSVVSGWVGRIAVRHRAEASSLYLLCYYLGSAVAGVVGGVAYATGGWAGVVAFVGALLVVACGLVRMVCVKTSASARKAGSVTVSSRPAPPARP